MFIVADLASLRSIRPLDTHTLPIEDWSDCGWVGWSESSLGTLVHFAEHDSFIIYFYRPDNQVPKWYKFDDGDVSECKMDDDEVSHWITQESVASLAHLCLMEFPTLISWMNLFKI